MILFAALRPGARSRRTLIYFCALTFGIFAAPDAYGFRVDGLSTPESFLIDPSTGTYYVSNIAGSPGKKDNNGFISRIGPAGKSVDLHFIQGGKNGVTLHAPKGLLIFGNDLYVADIDTLRRFDKNSGKFLGSVGLKIMGARFLNDLTADPDGVVFVSDTAGNAIYQIDPAKNFQASVVAKGPALGNPNGLVYDVKHHRLIVACWGSGEILGVDLAEGPRRGKIYPLLSRRFKRLDGIDFDHEGNLIVADHGAGKVYRIRGYSKVEVLRGNLVTPADLSFDPRNKQVLIPSFKGNLVFTLPLK